VNYREIAADTIERLAVWEMYTGPWAYTRWIVYALGVVALVIFGLGARKRIREYRIGRPAPEALADKGARFVELLKHGIAQARLLSEPFPGIFHLFLFWGFAVLLAGTVITFIDEDAYRYIAGHKLIADRFYIVLSFSMDLFGLLATVGIGLAAARRYIARPKQLESESADASLLIWILAVLVTGFLTEGARIGVVTEHKADYAFEAWSFVGYGLSILLGSSPAVHKLFWSVHVLVSFYFIATIPSSKARHIFAAMASVYTRTFGPKAKVPSIPNMMERMENGEDVELGYKRITDLTWREILQSDACTKCGRCHSACPAASTGKALSPMTFIQRVRESWLQETARTNADGKETDKKVFLLEAEASGVGDDAVSHIPTEMLWDCTNCMACMEVCPVFVEHVPLIVQMRRELAMEFDDSEKSCKDFFKNMDVNANPWGMNPGKRAEWTANEDIPLVLDKPDYEYLLWLGCMGGFDPRTIEIFKALIKVLKAADVSFAILGEMEMCCGDSLRRLGNEASFQALVAMFKETIKECGIDPSFEGKKVIVACPHGYNTLKHDYPEFGFKWQVFHHTEIISALIEEGRIRLSKSARTAVFHDSCFLSRYNDIVNEPRRILEAASAGLKEVDQSGKNVFCCGGGGGRVWLEEENDPGKGKFRINYNRADELIAAGADDIVSACPMCMMMLDDACKRDKCEKNMAGKRLRDIAEIVAEQIAPNAQPEPNPSA
jgi:Fe-S oxidoreductase/nitrate reductase gamma subunit